MYEIYTAVSKRLHDRIKHEKGQISECHSERTLRMTFFLITQLFAPSGFFLSPDPVAKDPSPWLIEFEIKGRKQHLYFNKYFTN